MALAHRFVAPAAVTGLLLLVGCATPDSLSPADGSTATTDLASNADQTSDLRRAVQAYSDAFLTGDARAYDMLSSRCQERTSRSQFLGVLMAAKSTYGRILPIQTFDASISGDLARVSYTYALPAINQDSEPWVREDSQWREDDC